MCCTNSCFKLYKYYNSIPRCLLGCSCSDRDPANDEPVPDAPNADLADIEPVPDAPNTDLADIEPVPLPDTPNIEDSVLSHKPAEIVRG